MRFFFFFCWQGYVALDCDLIFKLVTCEPAWWERSAWIMHQLPLYPLQMRIWCRKKTNKQTVRSESCVTLFMRILLSVYKSGKYILELREFTEVDMMFFFQLSSEEGNIPSVLTGSDSPVLSCGSHNIKITSNFHFHISFSLACHQKWNSIFVFFFPVKESSSFLKSVVLRAARRGIEQSQSCVIESSGNGWE